MSVLNGLVHTIGGLSVQFWGTTKILSGLIFAFCGSIFVVSVFSDKDNTHILCRFSYSSPCVHILSK